MFRRLAVFAGSFGFDAAQAVCTGAGVEAYQVLDQLSLLVDKSLVAAEMDDDEGDARYRLLETVRVYAARRLAASGEEGSAGERHRDHFLGVAREAGAHLEGPAQTEWGTRVAREYPNVRAALEWSLSQHDVVAVAEIAAALIMFWASQGPSDEGARWVDTALAGADELDTSVRGRLHRA